MHMNKKFSKSILFTVCGFWHVVLINPFKALFTIYKHELK